MRINDFRKLRWHFGFGLCVTYLDCSSCFFMKSSLCYIRFFVEVIFYLPEFMKTCKKSLSGCNIYSVVFGRTRSYCGFSLIPIKLLRVI